MAPQAMELHHETFLTLSLRTRGSFLLSLISFATSISKFVFENGEQFLEMPNSLERFNECPKLKAF